MGKSIFSKNIKFGNNAEFYFMISSIFIFIVKFN